MPSTLHGQNPKDAKHLFFPQKGTTNYFPATLDDDNRLRVAADFSGSLEVNLDYNDKVTTLPGDPMDSGATPPSNPSFAFTYDVNGYISTITVPQYNGGTGGGAKRTFTYTSPGFINNITAWTAVP